MRLTLQLTLGARAQRAVAPSSPALATAAWQRGDTPGAGEHLARSQLGQGIAIMPPTTDLAPAYIIVLLPPAAPPRAPRSTFTTAESVLKSLAPVPSGNH